VASQWVLGQAQPEPIALARYCVDEYSLPQYLSEKGDRLARITRIAQNRIRPCLTTGKEKTASSDRQKTNIRAQLRFILLKREFRESEFPE
jgi:hypothetical protein